MRISRHFRRSPRRGALPAVLAALSLIVQLLIPGAAMAQEARSGGPLIVMCTADGAVTIPAPDSDSHGKGFGGLKCHDCVMASVAAIGSELPLVTPVRYARLAERIPQGHDRPQARATAPPRPPSTAPPALPNT